MIFKTRGIVFRFTKFRETSIIVTIFTEMFGLQSYIVNGVRSKSAKNKIALYQPLTLLNLVVYHRENANIERIKEISCLHPYRSLTADVRKSTLAIFINELLNKTVKDESHAGELFRFISESLIMLDTLEEGYENFHLIFMLKLSRFLGFGAYNVNEVIGGKIADRETEKALEAVLSADYTSSLRISNMHRRNVLDLLLKFYHEHMESLGEIKSIQVLREVFT
jgi:DNA repair protein RecO (recombination protein O)